MDCKTRSKAIIIPCMYCSIIHWMIIITPVSSGNYVGKARYMQNFHGGKGEMGDLVVSRRITYKIEDIDSRNSVTFKC